MNKRRAYEGLHARFPARSAKSFERKFQNISGCLTALDLPILQGLLPARHFQSLLLDEVEARVEPRVRELQRLAESSDVAAVEIDASAERATNADVIVDPPQTHPRPPGPQRAVMAKIDFVGRESRNRELGVAGERWVLGLERSRLEAAGRRDLAERVAHVSFERGDGYGFDIESFDVRTAEPRLIEVKSTRCGIGAPFFVTSNELRVSAEHASIYRLYRVHSFGIRTRVYILEGDLGRSCQLDPTAYRALPRSA